MGPSPCPRVPGRGSSCLSAAVSGEPCPPRASLCKAPAPARSASARGEGQERGSESAGAGSPAAPPSNPPERRGRGLEPQLEQPAPLQGEGCFSPQSDDVLARRCHPRIHLNVRAAGRLSAAPRRPGAASPPLTRYFSSIHFRCW